MSLDEFYDYVPGAKRQIKSFRHAPGLIHTFHVPFDTLCAAGDVIGNLVGAFDHLAYQLVMAPRIPSETFIFRWQKAKPGQNPD